jgi:ferritin
MISKTIQNAINEQIKHELASGYLYLAMAAHFEEANLPGFAAWMRKQSGEEQGHAMKFYDYLIDRGGRVELKALEQPPKEWKNAMAVFENVLAHEQKVTGLIHKLYELAVKENDYGTQVHLQWFITEQIEEEKTAALVLEQLKMIEDRGTAILFLDKQLAKRGES